jgi:two-component system, sensor histidine kinase and response regulator
MADQVGVRRRERVLIVDDVPANVSLLSRILTASGYAVDTASNGAMALEMVQTTWPDLILLDIQMPEMDGYEVCEKLKADELTQQIPIIFISAMNDTDGIVRALNSGGVDYVTKPFKVKEVAARVQSQLLVVTQRRQIEALREQDRQHFESLDQMRNQFVQMAAHDLKNPLTIILGYAELLRDLRVDDDQRGFLHQSLGAILGGVEKMQLLIADMLDLAKLQTGVGLLLAPVPLAPFLEQCLKNFELLAQNKQITLSLRPPSDRTTLLMDAARLERAVDNLLSNAIKYTRAGGTVTVAAWSDPDYAEIQVADTGLGIPAQDLPHIFEVFFRVQSAEHLKVEGTGIGLPVVKSIVEQHHGQIFVESTPGQGSTFTIRLPRNG